MPLGKLIHHLRHSLVSKVIVASGACLLVTVAIISWLYIDYQSDNITRHLVTTAEKLSNTIRLGTHYAMLTYARDDISRIVENISQQNDIHTIRIFNKQGAIKYSNEQVEIDQVMDRDSDTCHVCHKQVPPLTTLDRTDRVRTFTTPGGDKVLGILSPIYNEPSCSADPCHVHPADKEVLGLLDLELSLDPAVSELTAFRIKTVGIAVLFFLVTAATIVLSLMKLVNKPIRRLIQETSLVAEGGQFTMTDVNPHDEVGQLALAINKMGREIHAKHRELTKQKNEYRNLFQGVPCLITVQDRDFRLLSFNETFGENFAAKVGDYCYKAYKNRDAKCEECPVEMTFETGRSMSTEETGFYKDGTPAHWIVTTSPVYDDEGNIVAAMEMCLDITSRKKLEEELKTSEQKYQVIFDNAPNAMFVLDGDTLEILDCNGRSLAIYGYSKQDMVGRSFLDLFADGDRPQFRERLKAEAVMDQAKHFTSDGARMFVTIYVSPSHFGDRQVLLVTTSDITTRLETEQQLIQAGKMATLGEMATGVAHELNQPLSVIQTIGNIFRRKLKKNENIDNATFQTMVDGINSHVERAAKIINHMREFGRKSELSIEPVALNKTLKRSFELFSQQLTLRNIEIVWELKDALPMIMADPNRLEQVFINLLINARDAIEERWAGKKNPDKRITLRTTCEEGMVEVTVCDTGTGIPKVMLDRLFEPFFTTKEVGKGTGLGLSISYGIVQDYGGTIRAVSREGEGACFHILFPMALEKGLEGPGP